MCTCCVVYLYHIVCTTIMLIIYLCVYILYICIHIHHIYNMYTYITYSTFRKSCSIFFCMMPQPIHNVFKYLTLVKIDSTSSRNCMLPVISSDFKRERPKSQSFTSREKSHSFTQSYNLTMPKGRPHLQVR